MGNVDVGFRRPGTFALGLFHAEMIAVRSITETQPWSKG